MERREFSDIRNRLGKTQRELASLLCISPRTIQSFEQGFRKIPTGIERQILLYYYWEATKSKTFKPCWKITDCPVEWRESCAAWQHKAGHLCWFVNGTFCHGGYQESWERKISICRECEVLKRIMPEQN